MSEVCNILRSISKFYYRQVNLSGRRERKLLTIATHSLNVIGRFGL